MSQREKQVIGSVEYQTADKEYFDKRGLRRYADIIGVAIWFLCGLLYFAVHGRKTLVYSPEEEFAIVQSQHSGSTP